MPFPPSHAFTELIQRAAAVEHQGELRGVLRDVTDVARRTTGAAYGALGVLGAHGTLSDFIYTGMSSHQADQIGRLPIGKGVLGTLIRDPRPIVVDDIASHEDFSGFPPNHPAMHSFVGVPVRAGDQIFGNLYLTEKPGGFSEEDLATASAMAAIAGGAVSATRLRARLAQVAVLEDRERIARDLHDAVIQDLFATGLSLQGLIMGIREDTVRVRIDDAVERIDMAIDALRTFIFGLRREEPTAHTPAGTLEASIRRLCTGGEALDLRLDGLGSLPADILDTVNGFVREAVSNACRHGQPATISVNTGVVEDQVEVMVADDGLGFAEADVTPGMGITNMRSRVVAAGGRFVLESAPGAGTTVRASIPV